MMNPEAALVGGCGGLVRPLSHQVSFVTAANAVLPRAPPAQPPYRGASLIRNRFLLGSYSRPMPRSLWSC